VLLGTVFPLLYEAVNGGQVTVGTPYFATVAVPMSIVLLVLMSLAPLVGWRTLDAAVLWSRLRFSAWASLFVVVALILAGVRRPMVLLAYFLATAAAGAALRTLRGTFIAAKRRHQRWYDALRGPSAGEWSCTSASS